MQTIANPRISSNRTILLLGRLSIRAATSFQIIVQPRSNGMIYPGCEKNRFSLDSLQQFYKKTMKGLCIWGKI